MPPKKPSKNPPKRQKTADISSYFKKNDNAGNSSSTMGSTQPGGTANSQPGGATASQPGGTADSQPGGATASQPSGATNSQPGGATASQPGGVTNSQPGGATNSQPGGVTNSQPVGATASQPGGATASQPGGAKASQQGEATKTYTRSQVKKESDGESKNGHLHRFTVKFSRTDRYKYPIDCDQPRTVLEAIKSTEHYNKKMKGSLDENVVIQLGKEDRESIVATHFPCSCIRNGVSLIISCESEKVEWAPDQQNQTIDSRDKYSVFYIDTVGGLHTKQKKLFRNSAVKKFKYLCVYGEKGMTVEEALKRDGRFIDYPSNFTLSDNNNPNCITERRQKVDNLDQKGFKIRLPRNTRASDDKQQEKAGASSDSRQRCNTRPVSDVVHQTGISVRAAVNQSSSSENTEEIYELLRQQFPDLKKWMESRFPGDSYQKALNLRKEDFGKIQQSFSEVHRVKKLLKLGESVCKVVIENVCVGTGFVLFDNYILTNAHLFKDCVEGEQLKEDINVFVLFNYEDPEPHTNYHYFKLADRKIRCGEGELDYAILELNPEGQKPNQSTQTKNIKVPPGLLKIFGPLPLNGEACIIGHPGGEVKKIDPTCVIEKEKRERAVNEHLDKYKDNNFILHFIRDIIKNQGIDSIMMGGKKAENVATYKTFMYHGSSGSPVFDAHGRVFGLHTGGYVYDFPNHKDSVIEFAQPLLTIFEHFVRKLKERGEEKLLRRVEEAKENPYLKKVLNPKATHTVEPADLDEHSDSDVSMEID